MSLTPEIANKWLAGESIAEVRYGLNDEVQIINGPNSGKTGVVSSLQQLQPEPGYVIATADGDNLAVMQSDIVPAP
jgi:hypothetical protein